MQNSKSKVARQVSIARTERISCPNCGQSWPDFASLVTLGAVHGLNLALIATCPDCGHVWGVNHLWRLKTTLTAKPKE